MSDYQIPAEVLDEAVEVGELTANSLHGPQKVSGCCYGSGYAIEAVKAAAPLIAAAAHRAGREAAARDIADLKTKNNQLGAKLAGMRQCIKRVETLLAHWETIAPNESYPQAQRVAEFAYRDQLQRALTGEGQISHGVEVHGG